MDSAKMNEIEARLSRMESSIAALQRAVDGLIARQTAAPSSDAPRRRGFSSGGWSGAPNTRSAARGGADIGAMMSEWFSSRAPDWWLSRLGIGFVVIAVLFLYSYAIEHGWIVPAVRVAFGALIGAGLFWGATRAEGDDRSAAYGVGLREILYGGALATWFVTAYAAAVWYALLPIAAARLVFFILGIVSTWIALQERREIFGFIAVTTGFATPFILTAPVTSLAPLALYLGAVAAIGLFIYLVRGWQSVIWITFLAFWVILNAAVSQGAEVRTLARGSIAISLLVALAGAAFTRVTSLRRQLLALGSKRYTEAPVTEVLRRVMELQDSFSQSLGGGKSAPDSLALWVMTLLTPVIAVSILVGIWPRVPTEVSGMLLVALGSAALSFGMSRIADRELRQVVFTAAALWGLLGIITIAPDPENVALAALFAAAVLVYVRNALIGPSVVAKATIVIALAVVIGQELTFNASGLLRWRWIISEAVATGAGIVIGRKLGADQRERRQGAFLIGLTYLSSLLVIRRVLEPVWAPLVTVAYALLGAALLVVSKRQGGERFVRQLGGVTIVIVVVRLLVVDMASVDTIWRVLLFLICGAGFLYAGYRLQPSRVES